MDPDQTAKPDDADDWDNDDFTGATPIPIQPTSSADARFESGGESNAARRFEDFERRMETASKSHKGRREIWGAGVVFDLQSGTFKRRREPSTDPDTGLRRVGYSSKKYSKGVGMGPDPAYPYVIPHMDVDIDIFKYVAEAARRPPEGDNGGNGAIF